MPVPQTPTSPPDNVNLYVYKPAPQTLYLETPISLTRYIPEIIIGSLIGLRYIKIIPYRTLIDPFKDAFKEPCKEPWVQGIFLNQGVLEALGMACKNPSSGRATTSMPQTAAGTLSKIGTL